MVSVGNLTILRETNFTPDFTCSVIDQNAENCRFKIGRKQEQKTCKIPDLANQPLFK